MFVLLILYLISIQMETGRLSYYKPNDGFNAGTLACKALEFTSKQNHIAHRKWYRLGCGKKVLVCTPGTFRCYLSKVMDAGPYGIIKGPLKHAVRENRWKVHVHPPVPKGWRYRALTDLSIYLYRKLGNPPPLSKVYLFFLP